MKQRKLTNIAIFLISLGTILGTLMYGPSQRRYVIPGKTVSVSTVRAVEALWYSSDVHGRTAVIFDHHLNHQFLESASPEMQSDYLDRVMRHGIVRTCYCVVPDSIWPDVVSKYVQKWSLHLIVPPINTEAGFIVLHEGGRIYFAPLSRYIPEQGSEKSLVVIEPAVWSPQEQSRIDGFIRSGQLDSDLTAIIGDEKKQ